MAIELEADARGLVVKTPYSPLFVSELKRIVPQSDRFFVGKPENAWIIDPKHAVAMQKLILSVYHAAVSLPAIDTKSNNRLEGVTIRVEYLGACKVRPDGSVSATGHDGQGWNVIIAESTLKAFFGGDDVRIEVEGVENRSTVKSGSLYAVLVISAKATFDEIRSAYRRMARLTHPDVNHEPDAAEQFKAVKRAWDVLGDATMRRRYDAGLALEASLKRKAHISDAADNWGAFDSYDRDGNLRAFRAPLRCGLLTIDGEKKLGRIHVTKIHKWEDIVNDKGQVMVSSWSMASQNYEVVWS